MSGISRCDVKAGAIYIKEGYWAGRVPGTNVFRTYHCPPSYCQCTNGSSMIGDCLYVPGRMCNANRTGTLCGECKKGLSVLVGSEQCASCSNLSLLYLLLYAVVLFILVMLIMLINLDVFTGYLNAWLYSYQVREDFFQKCFTSYVVIVKPWTG